MTSRISKRLKMGLLVSLGLCLFAVAGCSWKVKTLAVETPAIARSTLIYDVHGNVITHFRGEQHRLVVQNLSEIPTIVQNAVIAVEDERFWEHSGVDLRAIIRAARSNINQGGISEGGSTITQQYVGLTFLDRTDRSTSRKVEEIALALQFERLYSKEYILREYLNAIYFGEGAYGIKAAAQEYFGSELDELTIGEAALLAGLIQAPSALNPYKNPANAIRRRTEVLNGMLANGWITQKEFDTARTEPVSLKPRVAVLEETYIAPHFVEEVRQWVLSNPLFGETRSDRAALLFEGGLHIYTTLDPYIQEVAKTAATQILPDPNGPDAAVVIIENDTGYIRAMVGGRDFFSDSDQARFNLATQGGRQAGSAMKPIVLAAALEQGIDIQTEYFAPPNLDIYLPNSINNWEVQGGRDNQKISLYDGLVSSINTVYAQLSQDVGPQNSVNMAQRLGIKTDLDPVLSFVLGSEDVTTLDMATVFSTFARRGIKVEPTYVTRIAAANGTLLYEYALDSERVLDRGIADQLTDAMTNVVQRGTGWRARVTDQMIAGKTGTSSDYHDATFSGYSPKYTISVWVGFPEGQVPMEPPLTPIRVFGGTYPAQIFQGAMARLNQDEGRNFAPPASNPPSIVEINRGFFNFRMPDVIEATRVNAVATLNELGLVAGIVEVIADDDTDPRIGTVIEQNPDGFALVNEGDLVTLTVVELPSNCRNFLELVLQSELVSELDLGANGRIENNIEENFLILQELFILPEDCTQYLELQLRLQAPAAEE